MKLSALIFAGVLSAASGFAWGQLSISSFTIDGGGSTVAAGNFTLSSTFGQPDATPSATTGTFTLLGGFWGAGTGCPLCPADYNDDGGVDGDDVIAFFGDWDAATGCADTSGDGGIDGDDVIAFFERWDLGGC